MNSLLESPILIAGEKELKGAEDWVKPASQTASSGKLGYGYPCQSYLTLRTLRVRVREQLGEMYKVPERENDQNKSLTFPCSVTNKHFMKVKPKKTQSTENRMPVHGLLSHLEQMLFVFLCLGQLTALAHFLLFRTPSSEYCPQTTGLIVLVCFFLPSLPFFLALSLLSSLPQSLCVSPFLSVSLSISLHISSYTFTPVGPRKI